VLARVREIRTGIERVGNVDSDFKKRISSMRWGDVRGRT
jgi:hypothetical protein